jgi:HlyD family secretion protein
MTRASRRIFALVVSALVLAGAVTGIVLWRKSHQPPLATYRTETVEKRKVIGRITATGTLQATVTVLVGTQISGRIAKLYADWNSKVTKGELVAKIDPQLYEATLLQAKANYAQAKAAEIKAVATEKNNEVQRDRTVALNKQSLAAVADVEAAQTLVLTSQADVNVARSNVVQAQAQLAQAQVNLEYTNIISPIDGVVISRAVDVGQTVAASMTTPTIFTIAEDLRKMQVNTNVSEGDVGRLETGQPTTFTVDAFPGRTFKGVISQIRNAATVVSNVVTYDAVIDVDNSDLRLRPGMTANATVNYAEHDEALSIPNAALRFKPPPEVMALMSAGDADGGGGHGRHHHGDGDGGFGPGGGHGWRDGGGGGRRFRNHMDGGAMPPGTVAESTPPRAPGAGGGPTQLTGAIVDGVDGGRAAPLHVLSAPDGGVAPVEETGSAEEVTLEDRTLYVLRDGQPFPVDVVLGLSDGSYTEVVSGNLHEGDEVITDATVNGGSSSGSRSSGGGGGRNGPPRMF